MAVFLPTHAPQPPMIAHWRKHLPPASALPRSLGLTAVALLLALLSYGFRAEVWPHYPAAGGWSLVSLPFLVVGGLLQLLGAVQHWALAVTGPGWLRLVLQVGVAVVQVGTALLLWLLLLASILVLALLA